MTEKMEYRSRLVVTDFDKEYLVEEHNDARRSPRRWVEADVEVAGMESRIRIIKARTADLSLHGCGVRTSEPFAPRTKVTVAFTRAQETVRANGRVVYGDADLGMGIAFTSIEPEQQRILERWLTELAGQ